MNINIENEQLKEQVDNLKQDLQNRCDRCIELNDENYKLQNALIEQQMTKYDNNEYINTLKKDKEAIYYIWKKAINRENDLIVENEQLKEELLKSDYIKASVFADREEYKQRISNLVHTNTTLQNDLFSEQLIQDETEDYINRIKQELFSEHLKQVETEDFIDKLKRELKEYRGF